MDQIEKTESPVWVSTAGMGVSWLHVRFDSRPKYYRWGEYTTFYPNQASEVRNVTTKNWSKIVISSIVVGGVLIGAFVYYYRT